MRIGGIVLFAVLFFCLSRIEAYAEEVYLKNGDRVSGKVVEENEDIVVIETEAMGKITVRKSFIENIGEAIQTAETPADQTPEIAWERNVSFGYNRSRGNTDSSEMTAGFFINRNRVHVNELTLQGNIYYSSSDKKMDAQKWDGSIRYAYSFGSDKKWYNFYKLAADHDRFANVDYRLLPTSGIGYWFFDTDSVKAMVEMAGGYEYTDYRDSTDESEETVLASRVFLEKTLLGNSRIKEDFFYYPAVEDFNDYRFHSETVLTNPLSDTLSLNVSLIDDYDSGPQGNTKKNDTRLITSLTYSF